MGRRLFGGAILLVLTCTSLVAAAAGVARPAEVGVVASVYDGDTLALTDGRRVRLLQVDTPELGSGECYSRAARSALLALAPVGGRVLLGIDPGLDTTDRYGRVLRYITRNGVNVNVELVRRGAAAPYFYSGERGRHAGALMQAALGAKAARRCNPDLFVVVRASDEDAEKNLRQADTIVDRVISPYASLGRELVEAVANGRGG